MRNIKVQISEEELAGVLQACQTLQTFLEKIASPNELYKADFLRGLKDAQDDIKSGRLKEVNNFEDFIQ